MQTQNESIKKLGDLIQQISVAMLTTERSDGSLCSRPMLTQNTEFDGVLWFITNKETAKVSQVKATHQVNLAYSDPTNQRYVSVSGQAETVTDPQKIKQLWTEAHKVWFPDGPEDKSIVLLKVTVNQAEYWDSNRLVSLFGMAKAYAKGEAYQGEGAENKKIAVTGGQR